MERSFCEIRGLNGESLSVCFEAVHCVAKQSGREEKEEEDGSAGRWHNPSVPPNHLISLPQPALLWLIKEEGKFLLLSTNSQSTDE